MSEKIRRLTPKQSKAIAALLDGYNYNTAAAKANVNIKTLERWRKDLPHFNEALEEAKIRQVEDAGRRLAAGLQTMLHVLYEVATDKDCNPAVRIRSANSWIDKHLAFKEHVDFEERLRELEARL